MYHHLDQRSSSQLGMGTLGNLMKKVFAVAYELHSRRDGASRCTRGRADSVGRGCASSQKDRGHRAFESYRSTALGATCSTDEATAGGDHCPSWYSCVQLVKT